MKINFDWNNFISKNEREKTSQNIENPFLLEKNAKGTKSVHKQIIVDISDKVTDDFPYSDHGQVAEKLADAMSSKDYVAIQRDFMTVMSNSMSASDFSRMKEEGFDVSSMEPEQAVTILDKIKTVLAQSGTLIKGYNDGLSVDKLTEIMGNSGYAETIAKELSYADTPITEENMKQMDKVLEQAFAAKTPEEKSIVYLIDRHMEPTLANLYKAEHCSGTGRRQTGMSGYVSGGYSRQGENRTIIRKTEVSSEDYQQIEKEIENRILSDGLEVTSETMACGKWLLEQGLPVTGDNIVRLQEIKNITFPLDIRNVLRQSAIAIGEGKSPYDVNLNGKDSGIYKKATEFLDRYHSLSFQAVDKTIEERKVCCLKNMEAYNGNGKDSLPQIEARKLLEEVRLKMTVEANVKLLQSGYSIETAPMEDLIRQLEEAAGSINESLFGVKESQEKGQLYQQIQEHLSILPSLPVSVIGKIPFMEHATIPKMIRQGEALRQEYEQARESYETIMTAPRSDLGDSIKKAFRNVDSILEDMDLERNEANRRAIRIMGYNQITITEEHLEKIKKADRQVRNIMEGLKPAMTLNMIREGKNPLEMSMEEIQEYIKERENEFINDTDKFSEFLYKLDKKKGITEEEREAYIGIYRMFRQIEKSDGAVIGSLLEQSAEMNFSNLLSAVRTKKAKHTDIKVDDSTGITTQVNRKNLSISEQIEKGYAKAQKLLKMSQTTPDDVLKGVENLQKDVTLEKQFIETRVQEIRDAAKTLGKEKDYLKIYHQPITIDAMQSVMVLTGSRGFTFKRAVEAEQNLWDNKIEKREEGILKEAEKFLTSMEKEESRVNAYDDLIAHTKQILTDTVKQGNMEYPDIRQLQSVYKQLSVAAGLAKEENYEIPVQMGNEVTSINLKIIHGIKDKGEVRITMDTESYGKVDARFVETEDGLEGSILTDYMDGKEHLQSHADKLQKALEEALEETKTEVKSLFFGFNEKLDINSLETGSRREKTEVSLLYKVAKQFIYYVKNIEEV